MTWHEEAACRDGDTYLWETPNSNKVTALNAEAIKVCETCPVRVRCLADALAYEKGTAIRWHIWGGLTPAERARLDSGPRRPKRKTRAA